MEKLKIYLDANIIYGFFHFKLKVLTGETSKFIEPKIIQYLSRNKEKLVLFISCVVKAEVFRKLITDLNISANESQKMWKDLEDRLKFVELRKVNVSDFLVTSVIEEKFQKKNFINLIHLVVAKELSLYFLTGDKTILTKCKKFYKDVISYIELRKTIGN